MPWATVNDQTFWNGPESEKPLNAPLESTVAGTPGTWLAVRTLTGN